MVTHRLAERRAIFVLTARMAASVCTALQLCHTAKHICDAPKDVCSLESPSSNHLFSGIGECVRFFFSFLFFFGCTFPCSSFVTSPALTEASGLRVNLLQLSSEFLQHHACPQHRRLEDRHFLTDVFVCYKQRGKCA